MMEGRRIQSASQCLYQGHEMQHPAFHRAAVRGLRALAAPILLGFAACSPPAPPAAVSSVQTAAPEQRNFTGTWAVSGARQTLDMGPGRRVEAFRLGGSLMLTGEQRLGLGFRSDVIGLSDNQTGLQGRSVWTDERGDQIFSELGSATTGPGNTIQGRIVGGTGRFAGLSGEYSFKWHPLVVSEDGSVSGRVLDLKGTARLVSPPGAPAAGPGSGQPAAGARP